MEGTYALRLVATDNTDAHSAFDGLANDAAALGREDRRIKVVAAEQCDQADAEPGGKGRCSKQRQVSAEGHHMREGAALWVDTQALEKQVEAMRYIVANGKGKVAAATL